MNKSSVDLTACDNEPIHLIGAIQPHGTLLVVNKDDFTIEFAAANTMEHFSRSPDELLGQNLAELLGASNCEELARHPLSPGTPDILQPWFPKSNECFQPQHRLECLPRLQGDLIILEFMWDEEASTTVWEQEELRQRIISELIRPDALEQLAQVSAEIIRNVTGFDRVMIYRFAEDKHGEVIAESTVRDDSFFGLHYPASDIPDPARRHFVLNVMRSIPDINAKPVPILARDGKGTDALSDNPLDLTYSKLRAVAPVHIEYLNNMGVEASMSISLITNDQLWGLVACHHYSTRLISSNRLRFAELLGSTISALLQSIENTDQLRQSIDAEKIAFGIEQKARGGTNLRTALLEKSDSVMQIIDAQGLLLKLGDKTDQIGLVGPDPLELGMLRDNAADGVATTSHLLHLMTHDDLEVPAAGVAYLELSEDGEDYLLLFREHYVHTIKWAGKPDKIEQHDDGGQVRLSPRGSFALWSEERKGTSKPFSELDHEALRIIRRALFALNSLDRERAALKAQRQAEAEEARLRHALLDASRSHAMSEVAKAIAHELNQPLSAVANYVNACRQELRNSEASVSEQASELMDDAVAESSRAGDLVRRLRDFIARGDLIADNIDLNATVKRGLDLCILTNEDQDLEVVLNLQNDLRKVWADPVQVAQVILNLAKNSIAAMQGMPDKTLILSTTARDGEVEVSVRDTGHGLPEDVKETMFEPFHSSTTSGMGIGLSLCRSIVEAHEGRIWARGLEDGTEVIFSLPYRETNDV